MSLLESAARLARFALDMQALCATYVAFDDSRIKMRIGLHVGPVTAGIIGSSMLRYHLFGEGGGGEGERELAVAAGM